MCRKTHLPIRGSLLQRGIHGLYYYRLPVDGARKEFTLKTSDYDEAQKKALDLDKVADAPTQEIAFAQINAIKGFGNKRRTAFVGGVGKILCTSG